jgi:K+-transporting ATPase ATPase C chain
MKKQMIIALKFLGVLTILTGIIYPLLITTMAQLIFPSKANGSLIVADSKVIGSELLGQRFDSSVYFWSRPSAIGYSPVPSGASNFGPTSDTLQKLVNGRRIIFAERNEITDLSAVPTEMLTASASGLDPHISPEAAMDQVDRICKARHFNLSQRQKLVLSIIKLTEKPQFLILGKPRINVLLLNVELNTI